MPGVVSVVCKIPTGIVVQVYETRERPVVINGIERTEKYSVPKGKSVKLSGQAVPVGISTRRPGDWWRPALAEDQFIIRHNSGVTHGVDADTFEAWREQNKDCVFITGGFVKAFAKPADAEAYAREARGVKSGLERLDPSKMPTEFRTITKADVA
jgi:hypothetical protein